MKWQHLACIAVFLAAATASGQPVELVAGGESAYVIYHEADAPPSVVTVAKELQTYIERATGAALGIVAEPQSPMICLGDNEAAREAGLSVEDIPLEGFSILTHEGDVFIAGPDTPEGDLTPGGGTSAGTRNGGYAFLEEFVGVRWLMPGENGDYVPKSPDLTIPETDKTDAPFFQNRRVPYTQERTPEGRIWWARQRLGWSLFLSHGHNWRRPIPPELFDEHPDWFAMRGGVRVPPTGRYKFCTTNQGLVRAFADAAIAYFDGDPQRSCFSMSPSDSAGWCECEDCTALYEDDPNGDLSVTPAILTFYNDVAKLVAEQHPDRTLAGYVYAAYVFPPTAPIKLEPNVFLVWAPSFDYGFTLYRPALQTQWEELAAQWTEVTENIAYYDLPNCVHNDAGAPNPPGLKILEFLYPRLKRLNMKGVYVYGTPAWGHAGPMNYILAKLAWDPEADVEALLEEYCEKAYGAGAEEMKAFYRLLDDETESYFIEHQDERYVLSAGRMKDLYGAQFAELERLYRDAEMKVTDPDVKVRLSWLGDNLTVLHWNLRQFKMLEEPEASSLYLTDADLFSFLAERRGSLALTPMGATKKPSVVGEKLTVMPAEDVQTAEAMQAFRFRGDQHLVLKPKGDGPVEVRFSRLTTRGKLVTYGVYDAAGEEALAGVMSTEVPVRIEGDSEYYHLYVAGGSASYNVAVTGAHWAANGRLSDKGLHFLSTVTPVYFEVPEGVESFHLQLEATPPGETATGRLIAPDGTEAARFDCSAVSVDRQEIDAGDGGPGTWMLVIEEAATGVLDDVWVMQGAELSGYFSVDPEWGLGVE
ncbi:MAG: DUF4838 domain-containing protein [Candidatus Brocadiae bacterium]|nr:DUF4838 domain-containing protein [Candidatus Brocadiia bacterium]